MHLRELLEIGTARHGAIVIEDLDDRRCRFHTGKTRQITTGLRVTCARQHSALRCAISGKM